MPDHAPTLSEADLARARRRISRTLVASVALGSTGHIAAATVATIVARDIGGTPALAGTPSATVILGAAVGAAALSAVMERHGRRAGLAIGYLVAVVGAVLATAAIVAADLALLLAGTVLIGFGNAANQLSRYAAADLFPAARRASAIGLVVWASTIGAVVGPNLVTPAGRLAHSLGLPELAGAYLVPVAFVAIAGVLALVGLRPDPLTLGDASARVRAEDEAAEPIRRILRRPVVAAAIVALVAGQIVMVLIMTMTPLHMTDHGHGLEAVGIVISAHTFGMFALSPLSGRLTDRFGSPRVIYLGTSVLAAAALLAAAAPPTSDAGLFVALFLLGFGWNLGFVAGSALLGQGVTRRERTRVQGLADGLIWSTAAVASLGSGAVVAAAGYAALGVLGALIVLVPVAVLWLRHPAIRTATANPTA